MLRRVGGHGVDVQPFPREVAAAQRDPEREYLQVPRFGNQHVEAAPPPGRREGSVRGGEDGREEETDDERGASGANETSSAGHGGGHNCPVPRRWSIGRAVRDGDRGGVSPPPHSRRFVGDRGRLGVLDDDR